MIIQLLPMLMLILAPLSAYADVSDSGNLTIAGNGVIQGTMTVQGSAFSVGGATFSVASGSITLGGRLNASATGIKWADGTTSTTATGGGGNVVLNATQTFTGANTFGIAAVASTAATSGALINSWQVVASTYPSGAANVHFQGLVASATYRVVYWHYFDVAGALAFRINNDATAGRHKWSQNISAVNAGATNTGSASDSNCAASYQASNLNASEPNKGYFEFSTQPVGSYTAVGHGEGAHGNTADGNGGIRLNFGCFYSGLTPTSISFFSSTGSKITGKFTLLELHGPADD